MSTNGISSILKLAQAQRELDPTAGMFDGYSQPVAAGETSDNTPVEKARENAQLTAEEASRRREEFEHDRQIAEATLKAKEAEIALADANAAKAEIASRHAKPKKKKAPQAPKPAEGDQPQQSQQQGQQQAPQASQKAARLSNFMALLGGKAAETGEGGALVRSPAGMLAQRYAYRDPVRRAGGGIVGPRGSPALMVAPDGSIVPRPSGGAMRIGGEADGLGISSEAAELGEGLTLGAGGEGGAIVRQGGSGLASAGGGGGRGAAPDFLEGDFTDLPRKAGRGGRIWPWAAGAGATGALGLGALAYAGGDKDAPPPAAEAPSGMSGAQMAGLAALLGGGALGTYALLNRKKKHPVESVEDEA
jgi:hypothetical protein